MKTIAIIPARGGSKGIHLKNIAPCGGRHLIAWTIEAAGKSKHIDACNISTNDPRIAYSVGGLRAAVGIIERPGALATDTTPMEEVVEHALSVMKWLVTADFGIVLQPTSPLRTAEDIDGALELLQHSGANTVVSVYESWAVPFTGRDVARRQDRKPILIMNGAIYAFRVDWFLQHMQLVEPGSIPYIMPAERSIDIDTYHDLDVAGFLLESKR